MRRTGWWSHDVCNHESVAPASPAVTAEWALSGPELYLARLVDAQHQSAVGRIRVQADNVAHLRFEFPILGQLELFNPVRLYVVLLPNPVDQSASQTEMAGQGAHAPMGRIRRPRLSSGGLVFKVVSRIFCSNSGVNTRRERLRFCCR
jgi:hypothetical protein